MTDQSPLGDDNARFVRRLLIVATLAGLLYVLVAVFQVLLLAFGAVLTAIVLRAVAAPVHRRTPLGPTASLVAAVAVLALAAGFILWLFGSQAELQLASLSVSVPAAWAAIQADLGRSPLGARVLAELQALDGRTGWLLAWGPRLASGLVSTAASLIIVLFAGFFLALRPAAYRAGVLQLVPVSARPRIGAVLDACGVALRQWLVSQLGSMLLVGASATLALWLAGVRSPLALGLLAGLGQAVPLVGPFVAAAPGVMLALADGPERGLWAVLIYIGVGQVESNLFSPFLLRQMAQLPMAVTLFSVLAFGVLLGPLGVLFATPLTVVIHVIVRMLYIEDVVGAGAAGAPAGAPAGDPVSDEGSSRAGSR